MKFYTFAAFSILAFTVAPLPQTHAGLLDGILGGAVGLVNGLLGTADNIVGTTLNIAGNVVSTLGNTLGLLGNGAGVLGNGGHIIYNIAGGSGGASAGGGNSNGAATAQLAGNSGIVEGSKVVTLQDAAGKIIGNLYGAQIGTLEILRTLANGDITMKSLANGAVAIVNRAGQTVSTISDPRIFQFVNKFGGIVTSIVNKVHIDTDKDGKQTVAIVDAIGNIVAKVPASALSTINTATGNAADKITIIGSGLSDQVDAITSMASSLDKIVSSSIPNADAISVSTNDNKYTGFLIGGGIVNILQQLMKQTGASISLSLDNQNSGIVNLSNAQGTVLSKIPATNDLVKLIQLHGGKIILSPAKVKQITNDKGEKPLVAVDVNGNVVATLSGNPITVVDAVTGDKTIFVGNPAYGPVLVGSLLGGSSSGSTGGSGSNGSLVGTAAGLLNGLIGGAAGLANGLIGTAGNIINTGLGVIGTGLGIVGKVAGVLGNGGQIIHNIVGGLDGASAGGAGNTGNTNTGNSNGVATVQLVGDSGIFEGSKVLTVEDKSGKPLGHIYGPKIPTVELIQTLIGGNITKRALDNGNIAVINPAGKIIATRNEPLTNQFLKNFGGEVTFIVNTVHIDTDKDGKQTVTIADANGITVDKVPASAVSTINAATGNAGDKITIIGSGLSDQVEAIQSMNSGVDQLLSDLIANADVVSVSNKDNAYTGFLIGGNIVNIVQQIMKPNNSSISLTLDNTNSAVVCLSNALGTVLSKIPGTNDLVKLIQLHGGKIILSPAKVKQITNDKGENPLVAVDINGNVVATLSGNPITAVGSATGDSTIYVGNPIFGSVLVGGLLGGSASTGGSTQNGSGSVSNGGQVSGSGSTSTGASNGGQPAGSGSISTGASNGGSGGLLGGLLGGLTGGSSGLLGGFLNGLTGGSGGVTGGSGGLIGGSGGLLGGLLNGVTSGSGGLLGGLTGGSDGVTGGSGGLLGGLLNGVTSESGGLLGGLTGSSDGVTGGSGGLLGGLLNGVTGGSGGLLGTVTGGSGGLLGSVTGGSGGLLNGLTGILGGSTGGQLSGSSSVSAGGAATSSGSTGTSGGGLLGGLLG